MWFVCSSARPFVFLFRFVSVNTYVQVYVLVYVVAYVLVHTSPYPSTYNGMRRVVSIEIAACGLCWNDSGPGLWWARVANWSHGSPSQGSNPEFPYGDTWSATRYCQSKHWRADMVVLSVRPPYCPSIRSPVSRRHSGVDVPVPQKNSRPRRVYRFSYLPSPSQISRVCASFTELNRGAESSERVRVGGRRPGR